MASFYEFRMLNLPARLGISDNAMTMLKAHEDFMTKKIDEASLGRLIRLSPENKSAVIQCMLKCTEYAQNRPAEGKHCLTILKICAQILEIGDKSHSAAVGLPGFMKFPCEVRHRVIGEYLALTGFPAIPHPKRGNCRCAPHEPPGRLHFAKIDLALAFTCKQLKDEVMIYFFHRQIIHFPCTCEMLYHLNTNQLLKSHVRHVKFNWLGPEGNSAIKSLRACALNTLTIAVSKQTTKYLTAREEEFDRYWTMRGYKPRLCEARGIDELKLLRGLSKISVVHLLDKKSDRVPTDDRWGLDLYLQQCLKPKGENI